MRPNQHYVIGLDYGTDSVRAVIADASNGNVVSQAVHSYRRWTAGKYCEPRQKRFRQHPLDYIEGLEAAIKTALARAPRAAAGKVRGISVDTTGSTPVAVDKSGVPLSLLPPFKNNPNAMFVLWKDHTAVKEAEEINALARSWGGIDYTKFSGGIYSSEWFFSKILHVLRDDSEVREAAFSWVEHCDWIPALLTGNTDPLTLKRSRCAAGHKAMWHADFGGLPSQEFFSRLDPLLDGIRDRLYQETATVDAPAGKLTADWARRLGLSGDVVVGCGAFDAHVGAIGAQIGPYMLSKVMGTSTCDMIVAPMQEIGDKLIRGICGQVDGSIIPGMLGMEAGQSAFGDIYAWFRDVLMWPVENIVAKSASLSKTVRVTIVDEARDAMIAQLSRQAAKIPAGESTIVALDWMNGRRTPDANQALTGAIAGLTLGSDAPRIFRALVEATAFGARMIIERFAREGVPIKGVIALGGIAKKSPFVMQIVCDVLNMPIKVAKSDQACALGAAMCAATVCGLYPSIEAAQKGMGNGFSEEFKPDAKNAAVYAKLYDRYSRLAGFMEKS